MAFKRQARKARKQLDFVENRTGTVQRGQKTLTAIPSFRIGEREKYQEIFDKTSRLKLNLYVTPKEGAAYNLYWNFELSELKALVDAVTLKTMPVPYEAQKFQADDPETEDYKDGRQILSGTRGLCLFQKIHIHRDAYKTDQHGNRTIGGTPWFIRIKRAFYKSQDGNPSGKSQYEKEDSISLSDGEMIKIFYWSWKRLMIETDRLAPKLIRYGEVANGRQNERNQFAKPYDFEISEAEIEAALAEQTAFCSDTYSPKYLIRDVQFVPNQNGEWYTEYARGSVGWLLRRALCIGEGLSERYAELGFPAQADVIASLSYGSRNDGRVQFPVVNVLQITLPGLPASMGTPDTFEMIAETIRKKDPIQENEPRKPQPQQSEPAQRKDVKRTSVKVLRIAKDAEGVLWAQGEIAGQTYNLILDRFTEEDREAYRNRKAVGYVCYSKDGNIHCTH